MAKERIGAKRGVIEPEKEARKRKIEKKTSEHNRNKVMRQAKTVPRRKGVH